MNPKEQPYWYLRDGDLLPEPVTSFNCGCGVSKNELKMLKEAGNLFPSKEEATIASGKVRKVLLSLHEKEIETDLGGISVPNTNKSHQDLRIWCLKNPSNRIPLFKAYKWLLESITEEDLNLRKLCITIDFGIFKFPQDTLSWIKNGTIPDYLTKHFSESDNLGKQQLQNGEHH